MSWIMCQVALEYANSHLALVFKACFDVTPKPATARLQKRHAFVR